MKRSVVQLVTITSTLVLAAGIVQRLEAQSKSSDAPQRLKTMETEGPKAALTLYPVQVLERPDRNVADALGLILEKFGMENLDSVDSAFVPQAGRSWDEVARDFAEFVKQSPPKSAYALYAEYLGDRQRGPTEVRWVVTDVAGNLVLTDRQTPNDADFKRTASRDPDPMGCSVLVAERLFSQLHWKKTSGAPKADGKFARLWAEKSGTPGEQERAGMKERMTQVKAALKTASIGAYPTRIGNISDAASAARLATGIPKELGCQAIAVDNPMTTSIAPTSNEQKRLWDLARAFRAHVRSNPPKSDYALLAEFLFDPASGEAHSVHFVLCDKAGEWVLVDFQNNQQDDFRRVAPKSVEDCERLTVDRLVRILK